MNSNLVNDKPKNFRYLCLEFKGLEYQNLILKNILMEGLININEKFETVTIKNLINLISTEKYSEISSLEKYEFPHKNEIDHWHLTTYFKKKNQNTNYSKSFEEFKYNKEINVKVKALIIIPDKICLLYCVPECFIENAYGHITLLTKEVQPVYSNYVLEALFENDDYFKTFYQNFLINSDKNSSENNNRVQKINLNSNMFENEECYFFNYEDNKYNLIGNMKYK